MCARIGGTLAADQNTISASPPDGFGDVKPGITLVELDTDHVPQLSATAELAAILLERAR